MKGNRTKIVRERVAQEAALLLYTSQEKEYKQAKQRAAQTLGARVLPSNIEVAEELDRITEEREGPTRKTMILRKRKQALEIMQILKMFSPRLVGSVWRGTARKNSDTDIVTFSEDHKQVVSELKDHGFAIKSSEWRSVTKEGTKTSSFHISIVLPSGDEAEVVVRSPECLDKTERCETYGDDKTGLNLNQLSKVLKENPLEKFVPI
ncbi:MAG: nucleotidyltransferase domain-containing protein [Candidatus Bathyarchaeota archaeon]|nr:nucleotidyltransferase domain-containing protein [Candidatus Bathyarchaeota archaeon]